jgi:2Fe-2S ferredoxin
MLIPYEITQGQKTRWSFFKGFFIIKMIHLIKKQTMTIKVHFIDQEGATVTIDAPVGISLLEVAHQNNIDLEGACEGSLACSTCHVIVDEAWYDLLPAASEDEEDMLDLAFGLTQTSRLGCQIMLTSEMNGLTVRVPSATRNIG